MTASDAPVEHVTYQEIVTQTVAWREAIELIKRHAAALQALWTEGEGFDEVLFTGCGSTYYLSIAAATLWQSLLDIRGVRVSCRRALPLSTELPMAPPTGGGR